MARKVVLDVDTGIDDALALVLAIRSSELDVVGVTCVAGNTTLDHVVRNTLTVLELAGADVPVYVGARKPLVAPLHTASLFHGRNGLADIDTPEPRTRPQSEDAASYLARISAENPGEITLIAVGPLTNVAVAALRDPGFGENLESLIVMGGAVHAAGNVNGVAEANFANDPEAASAVVAAIPGLVLVDLGATSGVTLDLEKIAAPEPHVPLSARTLCLGLLDFYGRSYKRAGARGPVLHDPLAVGIAADPTLVTLMPMHLTVETAGRYTRGVSVGSLVPETTVVHEHDGRTDSVGWEPQLLPSRLARHVAVDRFVDMFVNRLDLR